jgi:tripartite-type tricarboxylate transporter receptor subunit TctC
MEIIVRVKRIVYCLVSTVLACTALGLPVHAQDKYPTKQIRMVMCCVGAIDAVARAIANEMTEELGQAVLVEPRPGAGGGIAANFVAKSKNDGYTILVGTNATHAANQSLYVDLPYDYIKDFSPIGGIGAGSMVLLVPANSPIHSVAELTALAKREPGKLTYGWAGTTPRIAMALYSQLAHIKLLEIPYKTNPQATTDLIGGQFDTMFADLNTSAPLVEAGKLRALAVSGPRREQVLPDVPTMQEAGVPNYSLTWWVAMWAPAGTPRPILERLNVALTKAITSDRLAKLFRNTGADPMPMSPDDLMKFQIAENKKWAEIVKNAGITPQ